jgi:hypothetical protein
VSRPSNILLPAINYDHTLVLSVELSNKSWVLAAQVPGLPRTKAQRTIESNKNALLTEKTSFRPVEFAKQHPGHVTGLAVDVGLEVQAEMASVVDDPRRSQSSGRTRPSQVARISAPAPISQPWWPRIAPERDEYRRARWRAWSAR